MPDSQDRPLSPRTRILLATLLAAAALPLLVTQARAHHSFGSLYTGTHSAGGAMEFDVSPDGEFITRFKFTGVPCEDEPGTSLDSELEYSSGGIRIANHAFGEQALGKWFSGSFPANRSASGSYQSRDGSGSSCVTETVTWNATTTGPLPPPCADSADNDGDGKVDHPADPGCSNGADTDETDPPPPPDLLSPTAALSGKRVQKAGRSVTVAVACPYEDCTTRATGTVNIPGSRAARRVRLRPVLAQVPRGQKRTLRLKIPRNPFRAIVRALRRGAKIRVKLVVTVRDAAQNQTVLRRTIRLRR